MTPNHHTNTVTTHAVVWVFDTAVDGPHVTADQRRTLAVEAAAQAAAGNNNARLRLVNTGNAVEVWDNNSELTEPGDRRVLAAAAVTATDPLEFVADHRDPAALARVLTDLAVALTGTSISHANLAAELRKVADVLDEHRSRCQAGRPSGFDAI